MDIMPLTNFPDRELRRILFEALFEAGFNSENIGNIQIAPDHSIWVATPLPLEGIVCFPDREYVLRLTHEELVEHLEEHKRNVLKGKKDGTL